MSIQHTVVPGDCFSSIAAKYGFFPNTLWNDPGNAALKERRKDPNVLQPGDVVEIPDKRAKTVTVKTGSFRRFRRKGVPARFRMLLVEQGEPKAGVPFWLYIDGVPIDGETDADGLIEVPLPPDARQGKLVIGEPGAALEFELHFGHLDPVDSIDGVQARLNNLGFPCGAVDGVLGEKTKAALYAFQQFIGHEKPSGEPDEATREKLIKLHDAT
jgi:hypothetical protein